MEGPVPAVERAQGDQLPGAGEAAAPAMERIEPLGAAASAPVVTQPQEEAPAPSSGDAGAQEGPSAGEEPAHSPEGAKPASASEAAEEEQQPQVAAGEPAAAGQGAHQSPQAASESAPPDSSEPQPEAAEQAAEPAAAPAAPLPASDEPPVHLDKHSGQEAPRPTPAAVALAPEPAPQPAEAAVSEGAGGGGQEPAGTAAVAAVPAAPDAAPAQTEPAAPTGAPQPMEVDKEEAASPAGAGEPASPAAAAAVAAAAEGAGAQAEGEPAAGQAQPEEPTEDAGPATEAPHPPAPPAAPPAPIIPGVDEEQHPLKPQWRRGFKGPTTEFLMVTVTQGDVNSRRMRPPRQWYDALLGGAFGSFEVEAEVAGEVAKFYPQAHAYEYCKSEYYVQGSECKRLFKSLDLQAGDALVLRRGEPLPGGMPATTLKLLRAADNPYAAFVLSAGAAGLARRAAGQADPNRRRTPKKAASGGGVPSQSRKRKMAPTRAADGMPGGYTPDAEGGEQEGGGRTKRSVRNRRFPYGDDFVTDKKKFWGTEAAAAEAGEGQEDAEMMGEGSDAAISDDSLGGRGSPVRRAGSPLVRAPPPRSPLLAAAAAAAGQEVRRASPEKPRVTAVNIEGRNVLRIKMPFRRPGGAAGGAGTPTTAGGGSGTPAQPAGGAAAGGSAAAQQQQQLQPAAAAAAGGGGGGAPNSIDSLVALAEAAEDGMDTGRVAGKQGAAAGSSSEVTLLSKSLMRDGEGQVVGAQLRLGWDPERSAFNKISRSISEYGVAHHELATVEDFEVQPAEHQIRLTLRVSQAGRVDLLERAVQELVASL